jgi:signal transduction histidine kinase
MISGNIFQKRPTRYEAIHTTVREQDMAWSQAEKREFGIDHAVAGRLFLEQTPLPPSVVEAVWLHHHNIHDAADRSPDIAGCVYLANVLAHQPPFENNGRPRDRSRYTRLCDRFGLSERSIEELVNRGSRFLSDLIASFPEAVPDAGTLEALRSRARKTLQRHIIVTQTIRRDGEKQNEAGTALCETARRLAFLPDSASILDAVAEAARKTLALDAVSIEFHDAGGTVYRKTAGHGEAGDGVTLHTTLITAQTWGRGALIAVGSPHTERPDIKEWMSRFGEVAETALILFYRHYRLQTLADRLADAYPAENATPEPRDAEDRLRDLNSMAARMAHLFNNLFAGMLGRTQLLLKRPDTPEKTIAGLQNIEQTVLKATRVIQLLQIASQPEPARLTDAVDLEETIREVLETHMPAMDAASIAVDLERMETVPEITGRREEIRLMLEQILLNSMEAMPAGGTISLASTATEQGVQITARDTGTGIPEDIIPFIFDPLFTTRGPQSLGLGLSLARSVMTRHRGTLEVVSGPEGGVSVIMKFPVESTSVDGVNKTGATMTANGSSKI